MENLQSLCKKRGLALLLAVAVLFTYSIPMSVFAEDTDSKVKQDSAEVVNKGGSLYYDKEGNSVEVPDGNFESNKEAKLKLTKEVKKTGSDPNEFTIDLKVEAKPDSQLMPKAADAAVVLVIDMSSSMAEKFNGKAQIEIAQEQTETFLNDYVKGAGKAHRWISLIKMGTNAKTLKYWVDANDNGSLSAEAKDAIAKITYDQTLNQGTNYESSFYLARNLMRNPLPAMNGLVSKSVVFLTDGRPTLCCNDYPLEDKYRKKHRSDVNNTNEIGTNGREGNWTAWWDMDELAGAVSDMHKLGAKTYAVLYGGDIARFDWGRSDKTLERGFKVKEWLLSKKNDTFGKNKKYGAYDVGKYGKIDISVGMDAVFEASSASQSLADAFKNINQQITDSIPAKGLTVTDTMGQFIVFDSQNTLDDKHKFEGSTLTWTLADASGKGIKTYTYSYKVKLNTAQAGFEEGKAYDTNVRATLTFAYIKDKPHTVDFPIPQVKGYSPKVQCSVEYYKWHKKNKKYPETPTEIEKLGYKKVGEKVSAPQGYEAKYENDNYRFEKGETGTRVVIEKLSLNGETVLKLYYKPLLADVDVNHYYKTDVIDESGKKTSGEYPTTPSVITQTSNLYVGEKFTAKEVTEYKGVNYTLDAQKSNEKTVTVAKGGNKINLYYTGTLDKRKTGTVTVNHIYKTGKWELNSQTGKYEEKYDGGSKEPVTTENVSYPAEFKAPILEKVGYKFDSTTLGKKDADGKNVVANIDAQHLTFDIVYKKPANIQELNPQEVEVKHVYHLKESKVENGKLVDVPHNPVEVADPVNSKKWYVGETVKDVKPMYENDGITYALSDKELKKITDLAATPIKESVKIEINYYATKEPKKATLKVTHTYQTYDKKYDDVTGEVKREVDNAKTWTHEERITGTPLPGGGEQSLYEGMKYTAALLKEGTYAGHSNKGYFFDTEKQGNTREITLAAGDDNSIEIFYYTDTDTRTDADFTVKHRYVTKWTKIVDGKVKKDVEEIDNPGVTDESKDKSKPGAKAGDKFTIIPNTKYDGKDYELVGFYEGNSTELNEDTSKLKKEVTLKNIGAEITLVYTRADSSLEQAHLSVKHVYLKDVHKVVGGIAKWISDGISRIKNTFTVDGKKTLSDPVYVGQKFTIDKDTVYENETYTEDSANKYEITLQEGPNEIELKYHAKGAELAKTTVDVKHNYSHTTIDAVGNSHTDNSEKADAQISKHIGESQVVTAKPEGYNFVSVTVKGAQTTYTEGKEYTVDPTTHDVTIKEVNEPVTVSYSYTKKTDNSKKAQIVVEHYYRTLDWNETTKEYTKKDDATDTQSSYATLKYTATPKHTKDSDGKELTTLDKVTFKGNGDEQTLPKDNYTVTLDEGTNTIKLYYTQKVDTREATTVKVVHKYYKHDKSGLVKDEVVDGKTLPGVFAGQTEQVYSKKDEGVWVGNGFTAKEVLKYKAASGEELEYKVVDKTPKDGKIEHLLKLNDPNGENRIEINYVYEYDATQNVKMTVKHVYQTTNLTTKEVTKKDTEVVSMFGNEDAGTWDKAKHTFTAKEKPEAGYKRATTDADLTKAYVVGDNSMEILYTREISNPGRTPDNGGGGGGGTPTTPTTPNTPNTPNTPSTDIPDNDVPLAKDPNGPKNPTTDIADNEVPLAGNPDGIVNIADGKVPLAGLPKTGGYGVAGIFAVGILLVVAGRLAGRRKED